MSSFYVNYLLNIRMPSAALALHAGRAEEGKWATWAADFLVKHLPSAREWPETFVTRAHWRLPGRQSGSAAVSSALWLHSNHPDGHDLNSSHLVIMRRLRPFIPRRQQLIQSLRKRIIGHKYIQKPPPPTPADCGENHKNVSIKIRSEALMRQQHSLCSSCRNQDKLGINQD